ncbi:MAG: glucosidase [Verrucomicrobia bacterium]|nr:glucosidase [Verrucomicrobiota bacterium]
MTRESERIKEKGTGPIPPWEMWGPYVSERAWGTVREDYSADGDAWSYFTHDHARFRAYRHGDDGIAGICDRFQVLLLAHAFWNGSDTILKERLFGLNSHEGNHGEDVKEVYYYLDATPSHSYLKYLYKYPQKPFPYEQLIDENKKRSSEEREFELIDTGIFEENRYFDIFIEYAKADPDDICVRIEAINRGPEAAELHILPHLWFRNQWSWSGDPLPEPTIVAANIGNIPCLVADDARLASPKYVLFDHHLGHRYLYGSPGGQSLFTNNETNRKALWNVENETLYVKDAFHDYLISKNQKAINPEKTGSKAALHYHFPSIEPGKKAEVLLRFTKKPLKDPFSDVNEILEKRKREADEFYESIHPQKATAEEKAIQRQALAGMIWNKQIYIFDVGAWLQGDNPHYPPPEARNHIRNIHWRHVISLRIFSMPDKWEYPWFAAWDLTFQSLVFSQIDLQFAKNQLWLLLFDQFQHPNGAIPAYEWEFSDVNPPVQAWAALKLFHIEKEKFGVEDYSFLEKCFHKLLLNFAWWVNKVDSLGHNIFEGGFLGMDNIGFSDRSEKLPPGFLLDQADGSGWMALLCLNLMRISLTLAKKNPIYEGLGIKFFQHFVYIAASTRKSYWRPYDLWDEEDGFFHSFIRHPDGTFDKIRVRSLTGIIPFFACDVWDEEELKKFPEFYSSYRWFLQERKDLTDKCVQKIEGEDGTKYIFGLLNVEELNKFLTHIWDPNEFRSEYGLRSLSKFHEKNPAVLEGVYLNYEPGESLEKIKGGNSNWRGPVWFPLNYILIETLKRLGQAYKDSILIQVGNETKVNLEEMAKSFEERLLKLFRKDKNGRRPAYGDMEKFQEDPHFKDHLLFFEHFHGDTGRGLGASQQTGWTGLIAKLIEDIRK